MEEKDHNQIKYKTMWEGYKLWSTDTGKDTGTITDTGTGHNKYVKYREQDSTIYMHQKKRRGYLILQFYNA